MTHGWFCQLYEQSIDYGLSLPFSPCYSRSMAQGTVRRKVNSQRNHQEESQPRKKTVPATTQLTLTYGRLHAKFLLRVQVSTTSESFNRITFVFHKEGQCSGSRWFVVAARCGLVCLFDDNRAVPLSQLYAACIHCLLGRT